MIVDAHVHTFKRYHGITRDGPTRSRADGRVAIGGREEQALPTSFRSSSFPLERLVAELDGAGIDRAVLLQGPFYGEENAYVAGACRRHASRLAGQAYLDPWLPGAHEAFRRILQAGAFRGVKLECTEPTGLLGLHPGRRLDEPDLAWLWDGLERHRQVLTLDLGRPGSSSYQTEAARSIAEEHPRLRLVICHLGQPEPRLLEDRALQQAWIDQLSLGRLANVWFDCAALPAYLPGERDPWPSAGAALARAIDLVGPSRLLWGSDIPGLLVYASYPRLLDHVREALAHLSPADRDRVFGGNAVDVYFS